MFIQCSKWSSNSKTLYFFEQLESKKDCVRFFVNKLFKIARYVLEVEKEEVFHKFFSGLIDFK